jgi:hypothetical protein
MAMYNGGKRRGGKLLWRYLLREMSLRQIAFGRVDVRSYLGSEEFLEWQGFLLRLPTQERTPKIPLDE